MKAPVEMHGTGVRVQRQRWAGVGAGLHGSRHGGGCNRGGVIVVVEEWSERRGGVGAVNRLRKKEGVGARVHKE